jgi:hypothetical protein
MLSTIDLLGAELAEPRDTLAAVADLDGAPDDEPCASLTGDPPVRSSAGVSIA